MGKQGAGKMMYSIGDVEDITGVKAHVLRYWETVIPSVAPQKTESGRRLYTQDEIDMILRMKYLIEEKKYTIEGARQQFLDEKENTASKSDILNEIHEMRKNLSDVYLRVKKYGDKTDK